MFSWAHVQAARTHYDDLIREANSTRLARQLPAQVAHHAFYCRILAGFGKQLSTFGAYLVARYGDHDKRPALPLVRSVTCSCGEASDSIIMRIR